MKRRMATVSRGPVRRKESVLGVYGRVLIEICEEAACSRDSFRCAPDVKHSVLPLLRFRTV